MDLRQITEATVRIAREAGARLRQERENLDASRIETKHTHDFVSYVDRETEQFVIGKLHSLLPEAGFITEEGTAVDEDSPAGASGAAYRWVVDPLDGTTNFLRDNYPYCVSIALRSETELLVGVVYEVGRDECFSAWQGGPSLLNGRPIHVSATLGLDSAYAILELPYNATDYRQPGTHLLNWLYGRVAAIRMLGSAAAEICYIAAGRYDMYCEAYLGRWDFSAGAIILRRAGGRITDFLGREDILDTHHIVATNGPLHPALLEILSEDLPRGVE